MQRSSSQRERRFLLRWRRNLVLGIGLGVVIGGATGAALGAWAFDADAPGMWASIVAGVIFGAVLGTFEGGMSSLESPEPGREPLQTEHPVRDVEDLTGTEGHEGRDDVTPRRSSSER